MTDIEVKYSTPPYRFRLQALVYKAQFPEGLARPLSDLTRDHPHLSALYIGFNQIALVKLYSGLA